LVAITRAQFTYQFNPLEDATIAAETSPYKAVLELATASDLLLRTLERAESLSETQMPGLVDFKERLNAQAAGDPSLIRLTVSAKTPDRAKMLANVWAEEYSRYVNEIYQGTTLDIRFFEDQLGRARQELETSEDELIEFEGRNESAVLSSQLDVATRQYQTLLDTKNRALIIRRIVVTLIDQLEHSGADTSLGVGEDFATILLQVQAFEIAPDNPHQVQLGGGGMTSEVSIEDHLESLRRLEATLSTRLDSLDAEIEPLPAMIMDLQERISIYNAESNRLNQEATLDREAYSSISRKLAETEILAESDERVVRVAGRATIPQRPSGPSLIRVAFLAVGGGGTIGLIVAFVLEYLQMMNNGTQSREDERGE
jgi:uncharacterized protein involved in exopolysaccharide biosynthesis